MSMREIIMIAAVVVAVWSFAQGTVSLAPATSADAVAQKAQGASGAAETVKVSGRGVGTDKDTALKDAYRDAIERAVGLYVDAEQMAKNDELVSDQILTQSNAYIEKYDLLKETKENGLVTVRILATVKRTALAKRISDVMPAQTYSLGDSAQMVHAKAVTIEKRNADAAALFEAAIKDFSPIRQMMKLSLAGSKMIPRKFDDGTMRYYYGFMVTLDEKKYYEEFLPPLLKTLDQIALKTATRRFMGRIPTDGDAVMESRDYILGNWMQSGSVATKTQGGASSRVRIDDIERNGRMRYSSYQSDEAKGGVYDKALQLTGPSVDGRPNFFGFSWHGDGSRKDRWAQLPYGVDNVLKQVEADGFFQVAVVTQMTPSRNSVTMKLYRLPPACAKVWFAQRAAYFNASTEYNIILKDKAGEEIVAVPLALANTSLANDYFGNLQEVFGKGANVNDAYGWYVTPMVHADAVAFQRWVGFDIPQNDLPRVASVSIELAE